MSTIQRKKRRPNGGAGKGLQSQKIIKSAESFVKSLAMFDLNVTKTCSLCANQRSPLANLRPLMKLLEISCHGVPWILGTVLLLVSLHKENHIEILVNLFIALIGDLIVVALLKVIVQRPRPPENKHDMFATFSIDNFSFPSGHTTRAAMLAYLFSEKVIEDPSVLGLVFLWAGFVIVSRVLLGRHYVSDVIFGVIIGLVEYRLLAMYWIPKQTSLDLLEPYFGHFHL